MGIPAGETRGRRARHRLAVLLVLAMSALVLFETPSRSHFTLRAHTVCELAAPVGLWVVGVANPQHLLSYGIFAVLAAFAFRRRPLRSAALLVLAFSAVVELEQAIFTVGHCRLRDMLPNVLAAGLATGVTAGLRHLRRAPEREANALERSPTPQRDRRTGSLL